MIFKVLFLILVFPILLVAGVAALSNGECYYCGTRLTNRNKVTIRGKKCCGGCTHGH